MSFVCSISGEIPDVPAISLVSNNLFEKRLLEKYVNENGTDPINGKDMTIDQIVEIKCDNFMKPRPPSTTSIPSILKILQDEWDALMLQSFVKSQQLQTTRQELSHALYQHDAACRVIARLIKENNSYKETLGDLKPQSINKNKDQSMEEVTEENIISEDIKKIVTDRATALTAERKKKGKQIPEGLVTVENVQSFQQIHSFTNLHGTSNPGILCLDLLPKNCKVSVTGGMDKNVVVYDSQKSQVLNSLKSHTKKVTSVLFHPNENICLSGSADCSIKIWNLENNTSESLDIHNGTITSLSIHPVNNFLLSFSLDKHWCFTDIIVKKNIVKKETDTDLTCGQVHPDGLIFATGGVDNIVKVWELKECSHVTNFTGHNGPIKSLSFSENGYYLATAADDYTVKIWDLRKLKNFKTIQFEQDQEISYVNFDNSGQYMCVAGSSINVYHVKTWDKICTLNDHKASVTQTCFATNAYSLASVSMDRHLKYYANP